MKVFIVVVEENRGFEVEREDVEKVLNEDFDTLPPECSYKVKEIK